MKRGAVIAAILVAATRVVYAGGLEIPDNGTEALARGGAFTAKADDATALQYNVAGLARQRGTRLLFDGNLILSTLNFQRDGVYPDAPSAANMRRHRVSQAGQSKPPQCWCRPAALAPGA